jgi:hypothetical protein
MASRILISNHVISAPTISPAYAINAARLDSQFLVIFQAPNDENARIQVDFELGETSDGPWTVIADNGPFSGGLHRKTGLPFTYTITRGINANMIGKYARVNISICVGIWTIVSATLRT